MRRARPVLEAGHVERGVELEQVGEGREALALVEVLGLQLQLVEQRGQDVGRQVGVVLQPHGRAQAPLAQALLDAGQQVLGPAPHLQVGVAGDPDGVAGEDVVAAVEARQVQADDVLEQDEDVPAGASGSGTKRGSTWLGMWMHGQRAVGQRRGRRRPDGGHQAHRAIAEIREGMAGIDGQRREHRQQRAAGSSPPGTAAARRSAPWAAAAPRPRRRAAAGSPAGSSGAARRPARVRAPAPRPASRPRVRPSGPAVGRPAWRRRLSAATRTMKNSSRFELKMARNFTRSSSGTLGSCASSSTRRLNSSHDSSRFTNALASISSRPRPAEGLAQQEPVADAARADQQRPIAAEDHAPPR